MQRIVRLPRLGLRTLRAFLPVLAVPDEAFAQRHLDGELLRLYRAMDRRDRLHGCEVAKRMLSMDPQAERLWLQAALLHDLGKAATPYHPWERILVHLWTPDAHVATRFPAWLQESWRRQRRHPQTGAAMLRAAGAAPALVALVEGHHRPPGDDPGARLLRQADEGQG